MRLEKKEREKKEHRKEKEKKLNTEVFTPP